jgi:hypothetical protein
VASNPCDDAELGKMSADRVDHRGLLADEELAGPMQHQAALLRRCLGLHKPHVGPGDRFADRLGIGGIILLPLDVRLHIGRRHQAHRMPKSPERARPVMRRRAGLNTNDAQRQLLEEPQNVAALQLAADDHMPCRVDAMDLKNRFCDVETDCRDRLHAWLPQIVVTPIGDHFNGTYVPVEEPSTASKADMGGRSTNNEKV